MLITKFDVIWLLLLWLLKYWLVKMANEIPELELWSVNTGPGNGLLPSGNKQLPEPMLTQISVAI